MFFLGTSNILFKKCIGISLNEVVLNKKVKTIFKKFWLLESSTDNISKLFPFWWVKSLNMEWKSPFWNKILSYPGFAKIKFIQ